MIDVLKWLWGLLALASFIGIGLAVYRKSVAMGIMFVAFGLLFLIIANLSKEALPSGAGFLTLAGLLLGIWYLPMFSGSRYDWPATKQYLDTLIDKPGEIFLVYIGLIAFAILVLITPPILVTWLTGNFIKKNVAQTAKLQVIQQPVYKKRVPRGWSMR